METLGNTIQPNSAFKFYCVICSYGTHKKTNYNTHLISMKHTQKAELETFNKQNPAPFFSCKFCNYITCKKSNYDSHLTSRKHLEKTSADFKPKLSNCLSCNICNQEYQTKSGLWKHKKICSDIKQNISSNVELNKELFFDFLKNNQEFQKELFMDMQKQMFDFMKNNVITNTINSNNNSNNTFNLQFFLNETCKNAMNIMEFVDSINLQLSDLESVGQLGYIKGISNIIVKNLKALDVTKRPIHCSDAKREVLYVKDNDVWEKEDPENNKIRKAIKYISHKNTKLLPLWKEKNPDWQNYDSSKSDKYNYMVIEAMGGIGENYTEKEDKIIRMIAKEVVIEK
jgi:hypothetical protein